MRSSTCCHGGRHREFGYAALVVMLVFYFAGAVWAAGSAIASGLFVPMLLIGSCIGRIAGLMAVDFAAARGHGSPGCVFPSHPSWEAPSKMHTLDFGPQKAILTTCLLVAGVVVCNGLSGNEGFGVHMHPSHQGSLGPFHVPAWVSRLNL